MSVLGINVVVECSVFNGYWL